MNALEIELKEKNLLPVFAIFLKIFFKIYRDIMIIKLFDRKKR